MSQPLGCHHQQAWPVFSCAIARLAAASRQRLGGLLLGCLSLLLALLLGVEPAAALDRVAVAAFPAAALQTSRPAAALQTSRPAAEPQISSPDPLPRRSGARGSVHSPLPDPGGVMGAKAPSRDLTVASPDSPSSLPALFQEALEASRAGRFDLALPLWNRVLERAPEDAAAWSNRGNVQLALGDPLAAIADQDHSLRLEPENADPHLNRGTAEEALGRWDAAAADYGWILERDPGDASALYNLGNVQGSRGDWQAARNNFVTAADARPGFAMARSSAALAAFQLGDLATAERELRSLIRRYPLFADARAGLTALLWQRGASGEAESHWAAASGLDPRYRDTEWLLGIRRWPAGPVKALERFLRLTS